MIESFYSLLNSSFILEVLEWDFAQICNSAYILLILQKFLHQPLHSATLQSIFYLAFVFVLPTLVCNKFVWQVPQVVSFWSSDNFNFWKWSIWIAKWTFSLTEILPKVILFLVLYPLISFSILILEPTFIFWVDLHNLNSRMVCEGHKESI